MNTSGSKDRPWTIVDLNYLSFYVRDYDAALLFYTDIFGEAECKEGSNEGRIRGWRMGRTWLTLFPGSAGVNKDGNPSNAEFAIQLAAPDQVDALYQTFIDAGARSVWLPEDTEMYEPMRFAAVDDPFGIRIDFYCPLTKKD